jgi:hypothetical protein
MKYVLASWARSVLFHRTPGIPCRVRAVQLSVQELEGRGAACRGTGGLRLPKWQENNPSSNILFSVAGLPLTRPCLV